MQTDTKWIEEVLKKAFEESREWTKDGGSWANFEPGKTHKDIDWDVFETTTNCFKGLITYFDKNGEECCKSIIVKDSTKKTMRKVGSFIQVEDPVYFFLENCCVFGDFIVLLQGCNLEVYRGEAKKKALEKIEAWEERFLNHLNFIRKIKKELQNLV